MINEIRNKIAKLIIKRSSRKIETGGQSFANLFKKSFGILVMMPEDEEDFKRSFVILKYLEENRKNSVILTYDYRVSLIPSKYRPMVIEHSIADMNRLNLPSKKLISKITEQKFNAVIDLNRKENLFYGYLLNLITVPLRIGFIKDSSDLYYNLQIDNSASSAEESYKNLLNCLQMF